MDIVYLLAVKILNDEPNVIVTFQRNRLHFVAAQLAVLDGNVLTDFVLIIKTK